MGPILSGYGDVSIWNMAWLGKYLFIYCKSIVRCSLQYSSGKTLQSSI